MVPATRDEIDVKTAAVYRYELCGAVLRAYVTRSFALPSLKEQETGVNEEETETFTETFSGESAKYAGTMVVPTGIEPVLPT